MTVERYECPHGHRFTIDRRTWRSVTGLCCPGCGTTSVRLADGEDSRDEVTVTDYQKACRVIENVGHALMVVDADEAAQHYLPMLTREIAVIFSFVGSNMTARHVPLFGRTVRDYQAAKDVTSAEESGKIPK